MTSPLPKRLIGICWLLVSLGLLIGQNMYPTLAKTLDKPLRQTTWVGVVTSINYATRTLTANLQGDSGPERIRIPDTFDFGSRDNPKIGIGSTITVQRIGNEYFAVSPLAKQGGQYAVYLPAIYGSGAKLYAPQWLSGYPRIVGTQLEGAWKNQNVPGLKYQLWYNSNGPSANGAKLHPASPFTGTNLSVNWNLGLTSELLQNGGFESDLVSWQFVFYSGKMTIQAAITHNRIKALKSELVAGGIDDIYSVYYAVKPGETYTASFWEYLILPGTTYPTGVSVELHWYNSAQAFISLSTPISWNASVTGVWHKRTGTAVAPANAAYVRFRPRTANGNAVGDATIYIDDCSLVGQVPISAKDTFYALVAIDGNGNSSPFSEWLAPVSVSSKVGASSIEIVPDESTIRSENFAAPSTGFSLDPDNGMQGNLLTTPTRTTLWHDESVVTVGNALADTHDTAQNHATYSYQNAAANGDTFTQGFFLKPGWYTFSVLGITGTNSGKIDWYFDDVLLEIGQDWYANPGVYNVKKTSSIAVYVTYGGAHTLKGVVNGKNAGSGGYNIQLTKMWFTATSGPVGQLDFSKPQNSRNVIFI
ncbi:MAG: hypothetical protein HZB51_34115 [Chloroflexi bacterium]|nr:hypothetical protein [Chloroflexota bacterium]